MNPIITQKPKNTNSTSGNSFPNFPHSLEMFSDKLGFGPNRGLLQEKELQKTRSEQFFNARARELNQVYSSKEKETQQKINAILEQLKTIAQKLKNIKSETQQTLNQPVQDPKSGKYYFNLFDMIKDTLNFLLTQIETGESKNWLAIFKSRGNKTNNYWGAVKKGGSSYLLSDERQIATSVG